MARKRVFEDGSVLFFPWSESEILDKTIAIVTTDRRLSARIAKLIQSVPMKPMFFGSAQALLNGLQKSHPNCIILDVRLPDRTGLKLQEDLLNASVCVPVIFVTGERDIETIVTALKGGAVNFLPKSYKDQKLLDSIHEALLRDRYRREHRAVEALVRERFDRLSPVNGKSWTLLRMANLRRRYRRNYTSRM